MTPLKKFPRVKKIGYFDPRNDKGRISEVKD
jgi:hypothetical protein